MIYFVKKDNRIEKYEVAYNKSEMEKLRVEIINKCSEIEHFDYVDTDGPTYHDDFLRIRNLEIVKVGTREYNDFYSEDEDLYHYVYDRYKFPYLVTIIEMLFEGNVNALNMILNPDYSYEQESFEKRIQDLINKVDSIPNTKAEEKIDVLEKLASLINQSQLNINQVSAQEYYPKVKELIKLKLIDNIDSSDFERIQSFFNIKNIGNVHIF